ncbi:tetratricopeptide repeat protein [Paracraurococcus lichenis]|uniref:Tetratricopeptide repeat protein n=1 Tax=Paracraurococcus lichenis TaxID=3064888 RepID=A0ABT9DZU0_9PROT|nr:tetratricopeptide repeat protein [Paracraurococcus sp. LOR1-02]MDO9709427.1 tetratricopeptide repeat protein [Paracraurococcus sp. LOR1-02]
MHSSTCRALLLATAAIVLPAAAWGQAAHDAHGTPATSAAQPHDHMRINPALAQAESARAAMPRRTELGGQVRDLPRGAAAPTSTEPPVLNPELGTLTWPAGTTSAEAQAWFNQGYRWAWGFNHAEAARAFRMAQQADPDCAMCFWGEAYVLGPHINFIMEEDANRRALAAISRAKELAPQGAGIPGELRAALIDALSKRYSADPKAERKALDQAYADAMLQVQARWPADPDIAVLTADALMNLSPWDYWEDAGRRPKGMTAKTVDLLEGVLGARPSPINANPLHPGAIHLYIHTVEASDHPERAAPHAARLAALMPAAGHIVHMPAHIWYRLGQWRDSLDSNLAAVAADEAQIGRGGASPLYAQGYFAHNVHFVMVSSLMGGDGPRAVEAATRLAALIADEAKRAFPGLTQPVAAAPYVAHARFSTPETILALPAPAAEFPYIRAHWHYARGVALAQSGRAGEARAEAAAIGELAKTPAIAELPAQGVPAPEVLGIAGRVVNARIAQAAGDQARAVALFAEAAAIQDTLPYMEPPFWYYPVHQSLGAALLAQGKPVEAEEAFRQALKRVPNNAWAAAGLLKAAEMRGDAEGAAIARGMLQRSWFGPQPPAVERL